MKWYTDLKIARKLPLSFLLTAFVAAAIGLVGARAVTKLDAAGTELYRQTAIPLKHMGSISTHYHRMRTNLWEAAMARDSELRNGFLKKAAERRASITEAQQALEKLVDTPEEKKLLDEFKAQRGVFGPLVEKAAELCAAGLTEEMVALMFGEMERARGPYQKAIEELVKRYVDEGASIAAQNSALGTSTKRSLLLLTCLCFAASIGLGLFTTRQITAPLRQVVAALTQQAESGRDLDAQAARRDEIGDVFRAATGVVQNVREATRKVENMSAELASAAEELSATTTQMATSNVQVATQSQTLSAAAAQMGSTVENVAGSAGHVGAAADEAHQAAVEGAKVVAETVQAMGDVAEAVKRGADAVTALGSRSDQIGVVVAVIEDIADQTNLLALNAAIEAARAGEHGRGFAVVADEVRKLAEKTVKATGEISNTIRSIQAESRQAVESMEQTRKTVAHGMTLANQAGASIRSIESKIGTAAEQAQQIASATEELSVTIHSAAENIGQIAEGVQQNSMGSDEISRTAATVAEGAGKLQQIVRQLVG